MKTISVINYKGGVGKTTLTANLAGELARRDYKVLMIDLDPQASLTFSFIQPEEWKKNLASNKTIKNWFKPSLKDKKLKFQDLIFEPDNVQRYLNGSGQLHLISSHLELINVDLELATSLGGANMEQSKQNFLKVHRRLINGIEQLDDAYDVILIDCPPNFNIVTKNAIVASDSILIPAKPDYLSTLGIDYLIRSLDKLVKDYNDYCQVDDEEEFEEIDPQIAGVLFTMVQFYGGEPISAIRPFISQTKKLDIPVFDSYLRENKTLFADAPQYGVPVVLTNNHRPDIVSEINEFVDQFEKNIL
ncbi:ParA family protein [Alistipes sp. ZOR0009]|uniref:ParA family protein n=1 Tax=Alistipes sp. ZOR0009 TaxID=1339253 RepID=UPI00064551D8|nr:AAA family ATPase [Alistipes sp. ZOR0009]